MFKNKIRNNTTVANSYNVGSRVGTELNAEEAEAVNGGMLFLLIAAAALLMGGCQHCGPYIKKDQPLALPDGGSDGGK